jgi:DNA recombination protein RmuC
MTYVLILLFGIALGAMVAWFWSATRIRAAVAPEFTALRETVSARDSTITEVRNQLGQQTTDLTQLRAELDNARTARTAAETRLEESLRSMEQQTKLLEAAEQRLKDTFTALSTEALRNNNETFTTQAEAKVKPLHDALQRFEQQITAMEKARQTAYGEVTTELRFIKETHQQLNQQTTNLVTALRAPQVKGRWGEITLKRVVEVAGMSQYCDFAEQQSIDTDTGKLRPDLVVTLPGGRTIVVDSKAPVSAYLDAVDAVDENARRDCLSRHAAAVRTHMQALSGKAYWSQFTPTPDFVVMFLPGEAFFAAALEQDRNLIEDGIQKRVILATPTTLIALLRTVAYSWQQQQVAENTQHIADAGKELFERVSKFAEHLDKVGDGLRKATDSYNSAVGSWTNRILPSGRRMIELGATTAGQEAPELDGVDVTARSVAIGGNGGVGKAVVETQ